LTLPPSPPFGAAGDALLAITAGTEALNRMGAPRDRTLTQSSQGEGGDYLSWVHPTLRAWLASKNYTLKLAGTGDGNHGTNYGGVFDSNGRLLAVSGHDWSNKTTFMDKLVIGTLIGIATAGVATAVGAAAGGAGAGGAAAASPAGALPTAAEIGATGGAGAAAAGGAAATAIPVAAGLPVSGALSVATALKAATSAAPAAAPSIASQAASVLPAVAKVALPIIAKRAAGSNPNVPVAPPAGVIQQMMPQPTVAGGLVPNVGPGQYIPFERTTPPWLIPAAVGGAGLLLVLLMNRRRK
jgi:hypothetical protein